MFGIHPKKANFLFILFSTENTESTTQLFPWSILVRFDFFSVFSDYNIGWKQRLHLENGLESYFNEWNVRNQYLKKVYWLWVSLRLDVTCKLALRQAK